MTCIVLLEKYYFRLNDLRSYSRLFLICTSRNLESGKSKLWKIDYWLLIDKAVLADLWESVLWYNWNLWVEWFQSENPWFINAFSKILERTANTRKLWQNALFLPMIKLSHLYLAIITTSTKMTMICNCKGYSWRFLFNSLVFKPWIGSDGLFVDQ